MTTFYWKLWECYRKASRALWECIWTHKNKSHGDYTQNKLNFVWSKENWMYVIVNAFDFLAIGMIKSFYRPILLLQNFKKKNYHMLYIYTYMYNHMLHLQSHMSHCVIHHMLYTCKCQFFAMLVRMGLKWYISTYEDMLDW